MGIMIIMVRLASGYLNRLRICRFPSEVPRMMYSETRLRAVTSSSRPTVDCKQPFTEYTKREELPCTVEKKH